MHSLIALIAAISFVLPSSAQVQDCSLNPQRDSACQPTLLPIGARVNVTVGGQSVQGIVWGYYAAPTAQPNVLRTYPGQVFAGDELVYFVETPGGMVTLPTGQFVTLAQVAALNA